MSPWAQIGIAIAVISLSFRLGRDLSGREPSRAEMRGYYRRRDRRSDFFGWVTVVCAVLAVVAVLLVIAALLLLPTILAAATGNWWIVWFEVPLLLCLLALRARRDRLRLENGGVHVETFNTSEDGLTDSAIRYAARGWWL